MTPQEKAQELVEKYDKTLTYLESKSKAKQCALIAVELVLESHYKLLSGVNQSVYDYWQQVKQEIEKL